MAPELTRGMEAQFHFCRNRSYRADFAWPEEKLLIEIEGGIFLGKKGKYTNPIGYHKHTIKCNKAVELGYRVLRFTPIHFQKSKILMMSNILKALGRWKGSKIRSECIEKIFEERNRVADEITKETDERNRKIHH